MFHRAQPKILTLSFIQWFGYRIGAKRTSPIWTSSTSQQSIFRIGNKRVSLFDCSSFDMKFVFLCMKISKRDGIHIHKRSQILISMNDVFCRLAFFYGSLCCRFVSKMMVLFECPAFLQFDQKIQSQHDRLLLLQCNLRFQYRVRA